MWDKKEMRDRQPDNPIPRGTPVPTGEYVKGRPVNIGPSILIKGELTGMEDLTIDGTVEGKIELRDHNLVVGPNGKIKADIYAKTVTITGEVRGNAYATEKVEIGETGTLHGDIVAPRIAISDGAHFKGSVDMSQGSKKDIRPERSGKDSSRKVGDHREGATLHGAPSDEGRTFRDLN